VDWYISQNPECIKRERAKAREIRQSAWWKNQLGKGVCYYCEQRFHPSELTMDHRLAIARGGRSVKSNLVTACKACNSAKKSEIPVEKALRELADK